MAKTKEQKAEVISKLESSMKDAASTVFVHFSKLSVAEESQMRRELKKQSVSYTVAKKTLIRRALQALGHQDENLALEGEIAVAYGGEDATGAARAIHEFGKKLTDKLSIVGGIFEGALKGDIEMREIATIPGMEVLRGMFAQIVNSPRQRFAVVLGQVAEKKN